MTAFATVNYPDKKSLSRSEAMEELASGPRVEWFRVWADRMAIAPQSLPHPWGFIHVHNAWGEQMRIDVVGCWSRSALRWGLHRLYNTGHEFFIEDLDGLFNDHQCHNVMYWLPEAPKTLALPSWVTQ